MQWTDYLVKKNIDELEDLTWEQANKVAEMLNEREPQSKIDELEDKLYQSEKDYEDLEDDYNNLQYAYDHFEKEFEEYKKYHIKLDEFLIDLEAYVRETYRLTDDSEISSYCKIIIDKFEKFNKDKENVH